MELKERARTLREQADAKTAEATRPLGRASCRRARRSARVGDDVDSPAPPSSPPRRPRRTPTTSPPTRPAPPSAPTRASSSSWATTRPRVRAGRPRRAAGAHATARLHGRGVHQRATCTATSPRASPTPPGTQAADRHHRVGAGRRPRAGARDPAQAAGPPSSRRRPRWSSPTHGRASAPLPLLPPLTVLDLITMATTDSTSVKWVREKLHQRRGRGRRVRGRAPSVTKPESALTLEP